VSSFAEWLERKELKELSEVQTLLDAARQLGDKWKIAKDERDAYADVLENNLPDASKAPARKALDALWPAFQAQAEVTTRENIALLQSGFLRQLVVNLPAAAVAVAAGVILYLFFRAFSHIELIDLAKPEIARGLLTFLFGVTTVGIAIIVVVAVFLGNGANTELGDRFQRGKDILTVLIGVFGAILGYYFGSDKGPTNAPPRAEGGQISGNANAAAAGANPSAQQSSATPVTPKPPDAAPPQGARQ